MVPRSSISNVCTASTACTRGSVQLILPILSIGAFSTAHAPSTHGTHAASTAILRLSVLGRTTCTRYSRVYYSECSRSMKYTGSICEYCRYFVSLQYFGCMIHAADTTSCSTSRFITADTSELAVFRGSMLWILYCRYHKYSQYFVRLCCEYCEYSQYQNAWYSQYALFTRAVDEP